MYRSEIGAISKGKFKPLCNDESQQEREHSTSEDSDIDESSQGQLKTDMSKGEVLFIC
jgi:hypothetical protein